jgi:hypothetical protein
MTTQLQAFVPTIPDLALRYQARVESDLEAALGRLIKAQTKVDELRDELAVVNAAMAAAPSASVVYNGPANTTVTIPPVDPVTGELPDTVPEIRTATVVSSEHTRPCADCDGDGRLPDKTGGGHHRCKACGGTGRVKSPLPPDTGVLTVSGPGVEPFTMAVGSRTRFAAVVYAYAEQAGIADPDLGEWRIVDVDRVPALAGEVIKADDYGLSFTVERVTP